MYDKIFKRVEIKYLLDEYEMNKLIERIKPYLEEDKYFKSEIANIYFDNKDNELIYTSLDKPIFKEKVRVRTYTTPKENDDVFLEIKNKYNGVVGKRRIKISLNDYYAFLNNESKIDNQILKEIKYHLDYYHLEPKIFIAYDRLSYRGIDDNEFRITFDSNLRSRRDDLRLESGSYGNLYFDEPHYIMEVKTLSTLPLWFTKVLAELKIYPKSFSKYGSIYKKESELNAR
ncbi:MAG: polyphosphate polymerase domain-containing protein [Bacilli bacterium]|nr:polyphosphate polymerase domain-containing protein [Bacilli bacterium]